jgi:hypothetical protein
MIHCKEYGTHSHHNLYSALWCNLSFTSEYIVNTHLTPKLRTGHNMWGVGSGIGNARSLPSIGHLYHPVNPGQICNSGVLLKIFATRDFRHTGVGSWRCDCLRHVIPEKIRGWTYSRRILGHCGPCLLINNSKLIEIDQKRKEEGTGRKGLPII